MDADDASAPVPMDDDDEEEDDEPPSPAAAAAIAKKTGILKETTVRAPAPPAAGVTASYHIFLELQKKDFEFLLERIDLGRINIPLYQILLIVFLLNSFLDVNFNYLNINLYLEQVF